MSDINKKLHDLLFEQAKSYHFEGSSEEWFEEECPELIERFKQVFIDAEWYHSPLVEYQMKRIKDGSLMTGQEAFEKLEKAGLLGHDLEIAREALGVDGRAAGLEEKN